MDTRSSWPRSIVTALTACAIVFVPLAMAPGLAFPFVTGKAFVFRALVGTGVAVLLWHALLTSARFSLRITPISIVATLLAGWLVVATVLGTPDGLRAFWGTVERMEGGVAWVALLFFAAMLSVALGRQASRWRALLWTSMATSVLVAASAFLDPSARSAGTLGSPTYLSHYAVLHTITATTVALATATRRPWRVIAGAIALAQLAVVWQTQTRGAVLALVAAMVASVVTHPQYRRRIVSAGAALAVAAGLFAAWRNTLVAPGDTFLSRWQGPHWLGDRPALYQTALDAVLARPVVGWGMEGTTTALEHHALAELPPHFWVDRSHSVGLDVALQGGLPALLFVLLLTVAMLHAALSGERSWAERRGLVAALVAWWVTCSVSIPDVVSWMSVVALIVYLHGTCRSLRVSIVVPTPIRIPAATASLFALMWLAAQQVDIGRSARALGQVADPNLAASERMVASQAAVTSHASAAPEAAVLLARMTSPRNADRVADFVGDIARQHPHSVRLAVASARMAALSGRTHAAMAELHRARRLSPELACLPAMRVPLHLRRGNVEAAISDASQTAHAHPSNESIAVLAALYVMQRQRHRAERVLLPFASKRPAVLLDPRLVDTARRTDSIAWLSGLWAVHATPDRPMFFRRLHAFAESNAWLQAPAEPASIGSAQP